MTFTITQKDIEEMLGFSINNFSLEPLFHEGNCIGLNVYIEPEVSISRIEHKMTISKTGDIKFEEDYNN